MGPILGQRRYIICERSLQSGLKMYTGQVHSFQTENQFLFCIFFLRFLCFFFLLILFFGGPYVFVFLLFPFF